MDFKTDMADIMRCGFGASDEQAAEAHNGRWWSSEAQRWVYAPEGSTDAAIEIERARCVAAVNKALEDWPNIPSEATKRFADMVIANIEEVK